MELATVDRKAGMLNQVYALYAPGTRDGYRADIQGMEAFTRAGALEAGPSELAEYFRFLKDHYKPATVNRKMSALSGLYSKAVALSLIPMDPMKALKDLKAVRTSPTARAVKQVLTRENIRQALRECKDPRLTLVIRTLATTGMRVSELTGINRKDVTMTGEAVAVRITGKGRKVREILIPSGLYREILSVFGEGGEAVFTTRNGTRYNRTCLYTQIRRAFKSQGLTVHPHDFRHFYAGDRLTATGDVKAVSSYLGHSSTRITLDFYIHSGLTADNAFINL